MLPIEDEYITTNDGTKIYFTPLKDPEMFKNRVILLYGETNSGKSTILKDILYILRNKVSIPIVFSPTDYINNSYQGIVPPVLIYNEVNVERVESIWDEQLKRALLYDRANDLDILFSLFNKVADNFEKKKAQLIINKAQESVKDVMLDSRIDMVAKKNETTRITEERSSNLKKLFKSCIRIYTNKLQGMKLDKDESTALKYLDFNPHIIIIFDDCLSTANRWRNEEVFKKMFMQGRHSYITQIYTLQDDKGITPDLRRNSRISIFTSSNLASTHFEAKSNGYHSSEKKKAQKIIERIFSHKRGSTPHYQKLIYNKDDPDRFGVTIADLHDDFVAGSIYTRKYTEKLPRKSKYSIDKRKKNAYLNIDV